MTGLFRICPFRRALLGANGTLVSDNVSYSADRRQPPASRDPGTGEPIGGSNPSPPSSQSILTLNTRTVNNIANGNSNIASTTRLALSVGGSSELLRYPDGNGLDTETQTANAGLTWRLNARNSLSGQYMFSQFSYPG